jgi:hypothetical protein
VSTALRASWPAGWDEESREIKPRREVPSAIDGFRKCDMFRMPPATEPVGRSFVDETIVWIFSDEKERQDLR